jgi:hypothetical protein
MPTNEKPQFKHDCEDCTFLGRYRCHDLRWPPDYDLYYCLQGGGSPTVIARYDDEGSHYFSGIVFGNNGSPLKEAYERAKAKGLLTAK